MNSRMGKERPSGDTPLSLPRLLTPHLEELISRNPGGPVARQFEPCPQEEFILPQEDADPLDEASHSPVPRLVHRYRDRALVLVTGRCAAYCRYCFRRSVTASRLRPVSDSELDAIEAYLESHPEIHELLLSGGDPLTLGDSRLFGIMSRFRRQSEQRVLRLATRMPVVNPDRITGQFISGCRDLFPVWMVIQCNHADELTGDTADALMRCVRSGIPVISQTVLLNGVNDSVEALKALFQRLIELGVKPYYLFQGDLAEGTSHFRVPLARGVRLVTELRARISGLAMPVYAVDLPGGGGKIPLTESYFVDETEHAYRFRSVDGSFHEYPKETGV